MRGIFVAGTDTGVGKTIITGLLGRYLLDKGYKVITQKWIQTGCNSKSGSDIELHLKIMGLDKNDIKEHLPYVSPYIFKYPFSPHKASELQQKRINADKIPLKPDEIKPTPERIGSLVI